MYTFLRRIIYIYTYINMYACMYTYVYVCVNIHTYVYIYIYTYINDRVHVSLRRWSYRNILSQSSLDCTRNFFGLYSQLHLREYVDI